MIERGPATEDEMVGAFLRVEINSSRYGPSVMSGLNRLGCDRRLVDNPQLADAGQNLSRKRLLAFRGYPRQAHFTEFPRDASWRRAGLEMRDLEAMRYSERRILSFYETARVLGRLDEVNRLIIETCIATGARISEVLGLKWKHLKMDEATIKIEQRVWHQDIGRPKSEDSKRLLGIGDLVPRYRAKAAADHATPESFVFQQKRTPGKPMWDSGVRDALHQAAQAECCDFPGLGPHSFRRANITWRQQVGGSAIEASKIAGHSDLEMTGEYTFVTPERQNELTRRIQEKLTEASKQVEATTVNASPEVPPAPSNGREQTPLATTLIQ